MKQNKRRTKMAMALILGSLTPLPVLGSNLVPLPEEIFKSQGPANPITDITDRVIHGLGNQAPEIPDTLHVTNEGGSISYDQDAKTFTYQASAESPIRLRTNSGADIHASALEAKLETNEASLSGPITIYQDEVLVRGEDGGYYNWKENRTSVSKVRIKVNGLLVRGSRIEYQTDKEGKEFITVHDAYITTEDVQKPSIWLGTGALTIYPGDYGRVTRLSLATKDADYTIPILGWFTFTHSLNPREGYMPGAGARSDWGTYLENSYGILFGNRRVEGIMPTADYLATLHLDFRTRRGVATGLDLEDIAMTEKHKDMTGFSAYYLRDRNPMINPLDSERLPTSANRYRIALQALWDVTPPADVHADWQLVSNINIVSDRYMLRDFLPNISKLDDKPDNTVRLVRRTKSTQSMIYTRFAPNDYYVTDERLEASFYRVRSAIGNTGISYETTNSATIMKQYLPSIMKVDDQVLLDRLKDGKVKDFYSQMMDTESFARVNTTHEFTTSFTAFKFLNITPKVGGAYTGYYDVGGIGSDNRFLGYVGCDFNLKFTNTYPNFKFKPYGFKGLHHLIQPYATYSNGTISSTNPNVPKIDTWSSTMTGNTSSPIPLDLCGFNSIDSWGNWNIWRLGFKNILTTQVDEERQRILNWDTFIDWNLKNANSDYNFSNLYNIVSFQPSKRLELYALTQTPTIDNGEGFHQYSIGLRTIPAPWLETYVAFHSIDGHPLLENSEQASLRTNVRLSEKYTFSMQLYYDITDGRMPIQQYSLFKHAGAWYVGTTFYMRDNGGKNELGFGISFTLGETGTALPISLL